MAIYTISPCLMRDPNPSDFFCYSNLLFSFTCGPHRVAIDRDGHVLDIYNQIPLHQDIIQTWLQLMSNTPHRFEKIPVGIKNLQNECEKFLVLCKSTKGQHKMIVNSIQGLDYDVDEDDCITVEGVKVKILDRLEAEQEINKRMMTNADFQMIRKLIDEEPFEWEEKDKNQETLFLFVQKICHLFKSKIENNRMYGLLYNQDGSFKDEDAIQELFLVYAMSYCELFGVDLNREGDSGIGYMDFKFSCGGNHKVILEVKLAKNPQLFHGHEVQLPAYLTAENADRGIYMVVQTENKDEDRCQKLTQYICENGDNESHSSELIIIDARKRPSASVM